MNRRTRTTLTWIVRLLVAWLAVDWAVSAFTEPRIWLIANLLTLVIFIPIVWYRRRKATQ